MAVDLGGAVAIWHSLSAPRPACLIIVRHGTTAWNLQLRIQGRTDIPLNMHGERQAQQVADAINQVAELNAVYTSPLKRATATATAITQRCQVPLYERDDLIERAFGCLEGMTRAQREEWLESHPHKVAVGQESWPNLQIRACEVFAQLAAAHVGQIIAVVSHGALINAFLHTVSAGQFGTGVTNLANGSMCVAWHVKSNWNLAAINVREHLSQTSM